MPISAKVRGPLRSSSWVDVLGEVDREVYGGAMGVKEEEVMDGSLRGTVGRCGLEGLLLAVRGVELVRSTLWQLLGAWWRCGGTGLQRLGAPGFSSTLPSRILGAKPFIDWPIGSLPFLS
jgi:hypothetical protein